MIFDKCEELFTRVFDPVLCTERFNSANLFKCCDCSKVYSDKKDAHSCCSSLPQRRHFTDVKYAKAEESI